MKQKKITFSLLLLLTGSVFAQEDSIIYPTKLSYLDSIKTTFVKYDVASKVDSMWVKELNNNDLYADITNDIETIDLNQDVDFELPTDLLKARLAEMDAKSPFNIEYNAGLENLIKSFLKNRRKSFERLMGLSEYYFPLFEDAFSKQNIPLEIKYLAVVESALNPKAVSRVGATGLWQFMYQTGKEYKLSIDSYVDERSDPLKASAAASQYMTNMYKIFGDWDLVLAAYNSGAGNVSKAIRRSGGQKNFWNIKKHLPRETQGYVPAFLATMYIYEYHKEHGIVPRRADVKHFETDTIQIKQQLSFKQISDLLDISEAQLQLFNPSYKIKVVPNYKDKAHYLRLPIDKIAVFTANEDKIYAYVQHELDKREKPFTKVQTAIAENDSDIESELSYKNVQKTKYHKVRRGESLSEIANRYDVSMSQVKKWNRLRSNTVPRGRSLKIVSYDRVAVKSKKAVEPKNSDIQVIEAVAEIKPEKNIEAKQPANYKWEKVYANKDVTKTHKIKRGESLGKIAYKYNVSLSELKKWNKLRSNTAVAGRTLKIVVNERVATRVKKPISEIQQDTQEKQEQEVAQNVEVSPSGEKYAVLIPIKNENSVNEVTNSTPTTEIIYEKPAKPAKTYKYEKVVTFKDVTKNYKVRKGDNLGEISEKFNVSVADLKKWNKLRSNNVVVGKELKIISNEKVVTTVRKPIKTDRIDELEKASNYYTVQKGDNLSTIAKRNNVTVEELREWNNLDNNTVQLETKLKVADIAHNNEDSAEETTSKSEVRNVEYTVQRGDFLGSIAKKHGVAISDLKEWNNINDNTVVAGEKLVVGKKLILDKNQKNIVAEKQTKTNKAVAQKEKVYQVRRGDSLFSIRGNELKPGMKLKISG
jgi:membrane-bound lytic murein transglycosylase D